MTRRRAAQPHGRIVVSGVAARAAPKVILNEGGATTSPKPERYGNMRTPSRFIRAGCTVAAIACALALACLSTTAIAGMENPEDTTAVNAVHLDMALVHKLAAASADLKNVPKATHDAMEDAREMRKDEHGILWPPPIDAVVQQLDRHPEFKAAVGRQGLSGRQYLLGMYALLNGYFAAARVKGGDQATPANLAKWDVNPDHYSFGTDHFAEIRQLIPND